MMNRSAGEPKLALGSASSAGGTWPCGLTIGRFATAVYSRRAIVMRAGSGAKPRSGESVQGCVIMILDLYSDPLYGVMIGARSLYANRTCITVSRHAADPQTHGEMRCVWLLRRDLREWSFGRPAGIAWCRNDRSRWPGRPVSGHP